MADDQSSEVVSHQETIDETTPSNAPEADSAPSEDSITDVTVPDAVNADITQDNQVESTDQTAEDPTQEISAESAVDTEIPDAERDNPVDLINSEEPIEVDTPVEQVSNNNAVSEPKPESTENNATPAFSEPANFVNPFIIESETEELAERDPDVSVYQPQGQEDEDDDDEYEPTAPFIIKKSPAPSSATEAEYDPAATFSAPSSGLPEKTMVDMLMPSLVVSPGPPPEAPTGPAAFRGGSKPVKHKRLSIDTIGKVEDKIKEDPRNISNWKSLISILKSKDKTQELRDTYEKVLELFPLAASMWVAYIDLELAHGDFQKVEKLFSRSLTTVYSVELWQNYLEYVLRMNNIQTGGDKARTTIHQTFDFVLDNIGLDRESGPIWAQYVEFVRNKETPTTWEQQQQMDMLRKIYRKAICIPLNNLESLWHGYNTFENSINKSTARKFLAEKSATYMTARSSLRELQNLTSGLERSSLPHKRRWVRNEDRQIQLWRHWIAWEEKNPLEATETSVVQSRIKFAYKQAVMTMWFYPEIWFEAADYALHQEDGTKEALEILDQGMKANPTSALLFFKAAEVLEAAGRKENARKMYQGLLDNLKAQLIKLEEKLKQLQPENGETSNPSPKSAGIQKLVDSKCLEITFTYIALMKAVKRMDGIAQARQIFGECRKLNYSTYHIYIASASMELRNDKPDIATKIFEIGLKRFSLDVNYIKAYIDFLIRINDDTNARALFETSITKIDPKEAKTLYEQFLEYEAKFGELSSLKKLEDRYKALYPGRMCIFQLFFFHYL